MSLEKTNQYLLEKKRKEIDFLQKFHSLGYDFKEVEARRAGELLVTSMDYDGMQQGFDHELLKKIKDSVSIPIIASGGAGNAQHFADLFLNTDVSAGLAASIFHDEDVSIQEVKDLCQLKGVPMRHV